ncbi:MAG: sigma-70 family RNA polymerase sigma factor [Planctomycetes bacterium]|nr:sigma-70 family RNA polymerase sigma factor [Planctomycetota bacterium]
MSEVKSISWESVYEDHFSLIVRFCGHYAKNKHDAEDLAQNVFINIETHKDSYDISKPIKPWIYQIARNLCLNHIRDKAKHREIEKFQWSKSYFATTTQLHIVALSPSPPSELIQQEFQQKLQNAMDQLSSEQREIILLKYSEKLTRNEIAQSMNLPFSTVKLRLFQGVKLLREILEDYLKNN